jgi:hypothetical protein
MRSVPAPSASRLRSALAAWTTAAFALAGPAVADWAQREVVDPRSGDAEIAPSGRNAAGFALDLLREEAGEVLAIFRLPPGERDFLDAMRPPIVALDQGPEQAVLLREGGLTWAAFPVWNGVGDAAAGLLRDLMQGRSVEVTYFLHGGGYKSTRFELEGAAPVIAGAFGVPERLSAEQIARAAELEAAIEEEGVRCLELKGKRRERCLEVARGCIENATSVGELRECVAERSAR